MDTARVEALLARERRVILGITGPPGAGKTRLAESIASAFDDAVHIPMDGFHLADAELRRLGRLDRKGAVDTFDAFGYLALLERIRKRPSHTIYSPAFDREIEQPIADSIPVPLETRLVVTEGNYLLDDDDPSHGTSSSASRPSRPRRGCAMWTSATPTASRNPARAPIWWSPSSARR